MAKNQSLLGRLRRRVWPSRPRVAVIRLRGTIGERTYRHSMSLNNLNPLLERAFDIGSLVAIALEINSPGGSPVQAAMIAERIRILAEQKNIPILAFIEDVAASGGYWLACAADEIFANTMSVIGSIGVISSGFGYHELLEKWGIKRRIYTAGDRKVLLDPFQPETPEDVTRLQNLQTDIHQIFKDMVRNRRGKALNGSEELIFSGEIWTGRQALELGLIDGIDNIHQHLRQRFGEKVQLRPIKEERSWLSRLGIDVELIAQKSAIALVETGYATIEESVSRQRHRL